MLGLEEVGLRKGAPGDEREGTDEDAERRFGGEDRVPEEESERGWACGLGCGCGVSFGRSPLREKRRRVAPRS